MENSLSEYIRSRSAASGRPVLLDGPMGTELSQRGFDVDRPGWSARALVEAPELVLEVHRDYRRAGAEVLTANTFRTHEQNLAAWGAEGRVRELTLLAIELARQVAEQSVETFGREYTESPAWVVGSLAPVGDCYRVEQTPSDTQLAQTYQQMAGYFREAGVDAVLLETHVSARELFLAAEAVFREHLPLLVSMTVDPSGRQMLDGTPLSQACAQLQPFSPLAVGINCLPVESVTTALTEIRLVWEGPLLVYANSGRQIAPEVWESTLGSDLQAHTELAADWLTQGVSILGGCCGTTPALIRRFAETWPL